jgi:hypothetical protein
LAGKIGGRTAAVFGQKQPKTGRQKNFYEKHGFLH